MRQIRCLISILYPCLSQTDVPFVLDERLALHTRYRVKYEYHASLNQSVQEITHQEIQQDE